MTALKWPELGIHRGVPYADYDSYDAVNHTKLRWFEKTAMHARYRMTHEPEPKEAWEFGKALHTAVFQPQLFEGEFLVKPKIERRSKRGKQAWAQFTVESQGRYILTDEEMTHIDSMSEAVRTHPLAGQLIGTGAPELSLSWVDEPTGFRCKGRLDWFTKYTGDSVIVDLKSTLDASQHEFSKTIQKLGYASQAAFYLDGASALVPAERRYIIIAVEKVPPYAVAVYELEPDAIQEGRRRYRRWIDTWAEAKRTNVWPGYDSGLTSISLPGWAFMASEGDQA